MYYINNQGEVFLYSRQRMYKYCDTYWMPDRTYMEMEDIIEPITDNEAWNLVSDITKASVNEREKAKTLAKEAHAGQKDKAGEDYFEVHVMKVREMVECLNKPYLIPIALLHDVIEDTTVTESFIRSEFSQPVADAVVALTKLQGETYENYIKRVKNNELARYVKICDLINNMDLNRIPEITQEDLDRVEKYRKTLVELTK